MPATTDTDRADLVFRALASKPRREILRLMASGEGSDDARCCSSDTVCACVFADRLGLSAPTVSHHMKSLVEAGLVSAEKRGLWVHYRLRPEAIAQVASELMSLAGCVEGDCK